MAEMVEGGTSLAWRLLATLEGGSLLLATSALLAYSARRRVAKLKRARRPVRSVLLTNTENLLGKELKTKLEARECTVHAISDAALRDRMTNAITPGAGEVNLKVDALVVVGAFSPPKTSGLQGMAMLVSEDVYSNLKLLEFLSSMVHRGGSLAWACAGAGAVAASSAWDGAGDAFDTVLQANLNHVAKMSQCKAVWVGRCSDAAEAAEKLVDALLSPNEALQATRFSLR